MMIDLIAISETQKSIEINFQNLNNTKREFAISLARKLDTLDEEDLKKLIKAFGRR